MAHTITIRATRAEVANRLADVQRALAGGPDPTGASRGLKLRVAVAFFSKVKQAFIVKARGGTDEAGIRWEPLSPKTLAYSRRKAVRKTTRKDRQTTKKKLINTRAYRKLYAKKLAGFRLVGGDDQENRELAKQAAILELEKSGQAGNTKIGIARNMQPGADYETLRDTGVLFNSLSPGALNDSASGASYEPSPGQVVEIEANAVVVGTNVPYAATHHYGNPSKNIPARPFWPEDQALPQSWQDAMSKAATTGVSQAIARALGGQL